MLKRLAESGAEYLAYSVSGEVTRDQIRFVRQDIESAAEAEDGRGARVLVEVEEIDGFTVGAVLEDLKNVPAYVRDLDRFAVVGDSKVQQLFTKAANVLPKTKARFFRTGEADAAREWLRG
jgi:hypothetical protein